MIKLSQICVLLYCFLGFSAKAQPIDLVKKDMVDAVKTAIKKYKVDGMSGLAIETDSCYSNSKRTGFYCVYLDLASRHIDEVVIASAAKSGINFPKSEFFDDPLFLPRIAVIFKKAGMSMDESNEFLRSVTPFINGLVEY